MTVRTTKYPKTSYSQGQQGMARILLAVWLLASGSPDSALAVPDRGKAIVPVATTSLSDLDLASTPPTPPPGGILSLPPDSPYALWGSRVASSLAIDAAPPAPASFQPAPHTGCIGWLPSLPGSATPRSGD